MTTGYRQEVFNVLLAQLLQERGVVTAPERVVKSAPDAARSMPDLLVSFHGLRTVIEGEVGDQPHARAHALESARRRVEDGIAHIGIAVVYPAELRAVEFGDLKSDISSSQLAMAVVTESEDTGFVEGSVDYLESALRRTFDQLVHEDVVEEAVAALDAGIGAFSDAIASRAGIVDRVAATLGILELPRQIAGSREEES